jgi:F-type H+-transporting ATPase subunit delta
MISAASRNSVAELREQLASLLDSPATVGADRQALADELYSVSGLLAVQPRLRRSLGDPSTDASGRADLAAGLLTGKVSPLTIDVVKQAVALRWSSVWDLPDAIDLAANDVLLSAADVAGQLDEIEDELFRFERILQNSGELAATLDDAAASVDRRIALIDSLLGAKVNPISLSLIRHAIASTRQRRVESAIDDLLQASAVRRARSVARVVSATELTAEQTDRLAAVLGRIYGRRISIRSAVDPSVQGGLVVRIGDEVINATVAARMAAARAALTN